MRTWFPLPPSGRAGSVGQATDLWIDAARELGDPVPDPQGERLILE